MKNAIKLFSTLILCVLLGAVFASCAGPNSAARKLPDMQQIINLVAPPSFVGNAGWEHHDVYYNFKLTVTNLHKDANGLWLWDALTFEDTSNFWHGKIYYSQNGAPPS